MSGNAEMIDIYDDNRALTGVRLPRKQKLKKGEYMMYVYALIKNQDGRYLITQRALDKKWAAGKWEVPGGGAMAGETSLDAIKREILEETGLDITNDKASVIYTYKNIDESGDNYFADIYLIEKDFSLSDVKIDLREALNVRLSDFDEIKSLNDTDGFLHFGRISEALNQPPILP